MQLSYYGYSVRDVRAGDSFRVDLRPFFSGYVGWEASKFKNGFAHAGESVFLLPFVDSVYMFVQSKDNEIIKKIERSTMSVSEIRDALTADDSIGFASFVYVNSDHLAICSTVLAPRISAFARYVNDLFQRLDVGLVFDTHAMTYTLPKSDAVKLTHVGKFTMKVQPGNRLRDTILGSLGKGERADFDAGSIEITVRPVKPRADNKQALLAALENVGDQGLDSFDVRAKMETQDKMTDVFIVGAGGIRDPIDPSDERTIPQQIQAAAASNTILGERLDEFRKDTDIARVDNPVDLDLAWPPAGAAALGDDEDIS